MFAVHTVRGWPGELQGRSGRGCILQCSLCGVVSWVVSGTHTQGLHKILPENWFYIQWSSIGCDRRKIKGGILTTWGVSKQNCFRVTCIDSVKCLLISFYCCLPTDLAYLLYRFMNFCFYFYADFLTVFFFVKLQTLTVSVFCHVNIFVMCVCVQVHIYDWVAKLLIFNTL